jgi:hypothetical protein
MTGFVSTTFSPPLNRKRSACRFSGSFHQGFQKHAATPAGLVSTSYGISAGVSKSFLGEGGN